MQSLSLSSSLVVWWEEGKIERTCNISVNHLEFGTEVLLIIILVSNVEFAATFVTVSCNHLMNSDGKANKSDLHILNVSVNLNRTFYYTKITRGYNHIGINLIKISLANVLLALRATILPWMIYLRIGDRWNGTKWKVSAKLTVLYSLKQYVNLRKKRTILPFAASLIRLRKWASMKAFLTILHIPKYIFWGFIDASHSVNLHNFNYCFDHDIICWSLLTCMNTPHHDH